MKYNTRTITTALTYANDLLNLEKIFGSNAFTAAEYKEARRMYTLGTLRKHGFVSVVREEEFDYPKKVAYVNGEYDGEYIPWRHDWRARYDGVTLQIKVEKQSGGRRYYYALTDKAREIMEIFKHLDSVI